MATAFLFPGQASQFVGMGRDLYDAWPEARDVFDLADRVLDLRLKTFCFSGPEESLRQTAVTQPAVFTHSVAALRVLEANGLKPDFVAGHSVGELAALVAAGVIDLEAGLRVVEIRGQAMSSAGKTRPGTMAAVIGLSDEDVAAACREASDGGPVAPANFNCPGQVVISGEARAVARASEIARRKGARRVVDLPVSGAFHSDLMKPAVEALTAVIAGVPFAPPKVPVVPNVTAEPTTDPEALKALLVRQVVSPVLWTASIARLSAEGVTEAYEVGPGNALAGMVRRIVPGIAVKAAGTADDIRAIFP